MTKILILGESGFIGSAMSRRLQKIKVNKPMGPTTQKYLNKTV